MTAQKLASIYLLVVTVAVILFIAWHAWQVALGMLFLISWVIAAAVVLD